MTVTFFGHSDTPLSVENSLHLILIDLIENHGAVNFYVGNNGNFDMIVRKQLEELSAIYNIRYSIVIAYYPNQTDTPNEEINTIYPEGLETVPRRFAISWRNKWMIKQSDTVVTYVKRNFGGATQFRELAQKQGKQVINLWEQ
ncbi:MAG: hypothetical protein IJE93_05100 [Clostridia bacterium]|nr:hypothetical protein [Clostridia bacterium]